MAKITEEEQSMIRGRFIRRLWGNDEGYRISLYEIIEAPENTPDEFLRSGTFVAKGVFQPELEQLTVKFTGAWRKSKGKSALQVHSFAEETPKSKEAIIEYLSSGLFRGIGPKTAERIYDAFGKDAPEIIIHNPKRLTEVKGIGVVTAQFIAESVNENRAIQDLVLFFGEYGITLSKIKKIHEAFPYNTLGIVKNDPFRLCKVNGFGFATVDSIAESLGTPLNSPLRIQAALVESIRKEKTNGNLFVRSDTLLTKALELLNLRAEREEEQIQKDAVMTEINAMLMSNKLASSPYVLEDGTKEIYLAKDLEKEKGIAAGLMEYINTPLPESDEIPLHDLEKALSEVEKELGITLALKQREAVLTALTHKMCIITGGPGTGKTTILVAILRLYHIFCNQREVLLLAPTGKAARRMSESTGEQAYTIHRGLGLTPREGEEDLIRSGHSMMSDETGFLCIDEGSMVDNVLMSAIVEKLPMGSRFLCIGDTDQLPSIGAGVILKDLIDSDCIPVVRLDVIYRQSETSSIVKNAQAIRAGDTHLNFDGSFSLKTVGQPMKGAGSQADLPTHEQVVRTYLELVKQYGIKEVAILCPRRTKILLSSEQINQSVQSSMFQNAPGTPRVTIGNRTFYVGDRIVQCKNTDTASNGDMGVIREIRPANGDDPEKVIISFDFDEGSSVAYDHEDMKNVQLGYALTVHRSQGSEFKVVLIPLSWSQAIVLYRNLIYTAITRGKEKVLLFGQKAVLDYAIRRKNQTQRNTNLDHFLQNEKRSRKII